MSGDNLIDLDQERSARGKETSHTRRAAAERQRWLEIWREAHDMERRRRGKCLSQVERAALAARVRSIVADIQSAHGARSGKVSEALQLAAIASTQSETRAARGFPSNAVTDTPDYRIDRFTSSNPKNLRGKLSDWLWVVEALAGVLGRDPRREIITLYDDARHLRSPRIESSQTGLGQEYDAVFADLGAKLGDIASTVARQFDAPAYYECCDKLHAAWHAGAVIECDGWFNRFNRFEFADSGWIEEEASYTEDLVERSPLGPVSELLIHTPLARVSLCFLEPDDELCALGFRADWGSIELDIHLAIRPDVDDPRDAGALLVHTFVAAYDSNLGHDRGGKNWWRAVPQVAVPLADERWRDELIGAIPAPPDQHHERAANLAREHLGQLRLLPLTGENCQAWLSFGANPEAPIFDPWFWWDPSAIDVDPRSVVSAPSGTLAGHIQYNLVMAEAAGAEAQRIDRLLTADADRKVSALRRLMAKKKAAYDERLSRVLPESPSHEV